MQTENIACTPNVEVEQGATAQAQTKLLYRESSTHSTIGEDAAARPLQRKLDTAGCVGYWLAFVSRLFSVSGSKKFFPDENQTQVPQAPQSPLQARPSVSHHTK